VKRDAFTEIERAKSALWSLDAGADHNTWVRHAMGAKAAGLGFEDFHDWSATAGTTRTKPSAEASGSPSRKAASVRVRCSMPHASQDGATTEKHPPSARNRTKNDRSSPRQAKPPPHDPRALWDACEPATADHDYIERKKGLPDGLRVYHGPLTIAGIACAGSLVLPCYSLAGELVNLQFVYSMSGSPTAARASCFCRASRYRRRPTLV
jgi:hypothetical protein